MPLLLCENSIRCLKKKLSKYNVPIFNAQVAPVNLKKFVKKQVIAFAGIGNPQKFYDTLTDVKIKIKRLFEFPDHYEYKDGDFEKILGVAGNLPILTTTKDYVKIPTKYRKKIIPVEIDLSIKNIEKFLDVILK